MPGVLAVVPCGKAKVWDRHPRRGAVRAKEAYTGAPFVVNREYAERCADAWVILSAKYGFISPDFAIPGPYNVSFKLPSTEPIGTAALRQQVAQSRLDRFDRIVCLGGKEYRDAATAAFSHVKQRLSFPFAGLGLGPAMSATKKASCL